MPTALTIHAGFYPQLAKSLSSRFSFNRSVAKGKGVTSARGASRDFVTHVRELTDAYSEPGGQGSDDYFNRPSVSRAVGELLSPMGMPVLTAFGRKLGPLAGIAGAILGANWNKQRAKGTFLNKSIERGQTWKEILGDDAAKYEKRHKKYSLRGNYVWYMDKAQGPKAMAEAVFHAGRKFSFSSGERWFLGHANQNIHGMAAWAEDVLDMTGDNANLSQEDIKRISAISNDEAESAILDNYMAVGEAPKVAGYPHSSDYVLGEDRIESTEQPGKSHGLMKEPPFDDIQSGQPEKVKAEMAKVWEDFMDNDNIAVWNKSVTKMLKKATTGWDVVQKAQNLKAKEWKKEIKTVEKTGTTPQAKDDAAAQAYQRMNTMQTQNLKHNLVNSATTRISKWREGIPLGPRSVATGKRMYASTPIKMDRKTLMFERSGRVSILDAISHGHGLMIQQGAMNEVEAANHYLTQQMTYAHGHANNVGNVTHQNGLTIQTLNGVQTGIKHKVNVSFSKVGAKKWLDKFSKNIIKEMYKDIKTEQSRIKGRLRDRAAFQSDNSSLFWAAPYIGVEEGLYITK